MGSIRGSTQESMNNLQRWVVLNVKKSVSEHLRIANDGIAPVFRLARRRAFEYPKVDLCVGDQECSDADDRHRAENSYSGARIFFSEAGMAQH
jgi:hypothetical protein